MNIFTAVSGPDCNTLAKVLWQQYLQRIRAGTEEALETRKELIGKIEKKCLEKNSIDGITCCLDLCADVEEAELSSRALNNS